MAQFETNSGADNITEVIRQMERANLFTDENVKDLLAVGANIMLDSVKSAFVEAGHNNVSRARRTGETYRHIRKTSSVKKDKHGVPYMQVTISGKDSRKQRYAIKGFVLNYGRRTGGKITPDYYWSNAVKNTWQRVNDAMADVAAKKLKGE